MGGAADRQWPASPAIRSERLTEMLRGPDWRRQSPTTAVEGEALAAAMAPLRLIPEPALQVEALRGAATAWRGRAAQASAAQQPSAARDALQQWRVFMRLADALAAAQRPAA